MTRRQIRNVVAWLAGVVLLVWLAGLALKAVAQKLDPNEGKAAEVLALKDQKYDVLYLGNSVPYQGINPAVVDELAQTKSYNLALGGATTIQNEILLRRYLVRNERPKLVVLAVTPNLGNFGEGMRPSIYLGLGDDERAAYARYLERHNLRPFDLADEILIRIPAYRHRGVLDPLLKYLWRGSSRVPKIVQGHLTYDETNPVSAVFSPRDAEIEKLGLASLIDFSAEQKLPLLLVELPNSPSFNASVRKREAALAALQELIAGRPGVRFVSFNGPDAPAFTPDDWIGANHFNVRGAEKFSRLLAPELRKTLAESARP